MSVEATVLPAAMLGISGLVVLAAGEYGGELELLVETSESVTGCPRCGVVAVAHGRREHLVRDIPSAGRPVLLVWRKRLWRCAEPACPQRTWSERHPQVAPRAALTERARRWACEQVGRDGHTVEAVADRLGVGWNTVMRAVKAYGQPLLDAEDRLQGVRSLGVDEHVWQHAGPRRRTGFATGIVDLTPGRGPRVLDVVQGRSGKVYADWLARQQPAWRERISVAALDPFRGYKNAIDDKLADATAVLDAFHVVALAGHAVDEVRRRVQQETLGHRGRSGDPLYGIRNVLRCAVERLTDKQQARLDAAIAADERHDAVHVAWQCAQRVRAAYAHPDPAAGRQLAEQVVDGFPSCPIPEIARLGRTLRQWKDAFLAYFDTDRASNGGTEAICECLPGWSGTGWSGWFRSR